MGKHKNGSSQQDNKYRGEAYHAMQENPFNSSIAILAKNSAIL